MNDNTAHSFIVYGLPKEIFANSRAWQKSNTRKGIFSIGLCARYFLFYSAKVREMHLNHEQSTSPISTKPFWLFTWK